MATLVQLQPNVAHLETAELDRKEQLLLTQLRQMGRVVVAYSGGADSAYLAWAAYRALSDGAIAVTADSESLPASHKRDAEAFALECGFRHEYIQTYEFDNPDYVKNDKNRCFHCKDELFTRLAHYVQQRGDNAQVIFGANTDDLGDYRPGQQAAREHGVRAPLVEAGLSKAEIRELSRRAHLSTWDRPAAACLSSRLPYGTEATRERILTIEQGEEAVRALGFRQFRVRFHGELVRLEIAPDELSKALNAEAAKAFTEIFKQLGFKYVTLDLEGYRQGSLNDAPKSVKHADAP